MFIVRTGVKGAARVETREYESDEDAILKADRWARSNSTGSYWAEVTTDEGEVIARFNLDSAEKEGR